MLKSSSSTSRDDGVLTDLRALWYLESRQSANRLRRLLRDPARLIIYSVVVAYFVFMAFVRSNRTHAVHMHLVGEPYAGAALFTYVTLLAFIAYSGTSGFLGSFASAADAHFLAGSHIGQRLVVAWLQLRRSSRAIGRMLFTIVLYALIFYRSGTFSGISLAIFGGTLLATAVSVPALKLRNAYGVRFARTFAAALAVIAGAPALVLYASLLVPIPWTSQIESIGAGTAFNALLQANPAALGGLYAASVLLFAITYAVGSDLYPDLYAASLKMAAFREKSKRGGSAMFVMEHAYERVNGSTDSHAFTHRFNGAWSIAWKEWIGFGRSPSMKRVFWLGLAGCVAAGIIAGRMVARSSDPSGDAIAMGTMGANMVVIFVAMGSAIALAADLRKSLWWIGGDPLWMRLLAWVFGTSWRLGVCIAAGAFAWGIAMHQDVIAAAGIPVSLAAVLYLRSVGLAIYSLFPSSVDQRGPLSIIRALITYILAAPPIVAAIVAGVLLKSPPAGAAAGIALSFVETLALIAFASSRIDGRGFAFVEAETA
jgi:hypothetical protein